MTLAIPRVVVPGACACSPIDQKCICAPANLGEMTSDLVITKLRADEAEKAGLAGAASLRAAVLKSAAALVTTLTPTHAPTHIHRTRTDETSNEKATTMNTSHDYWIRTFRADGDAPLADLITRIRDTGKVPADVPRTSLKSAIIAIENKRGTVVRHDELEQQSEPFLRGTLKALAGSINLHDLRSLRTDEALDIADELDARKRADEKARVKHEWDKQHLGTLGLSLTPPPARSQTQLRTDGSSLADRVASELATRQRADEDERLKHEWDNQHLATLRAGEAAKAKLDARPTPPEAA